MDQNKIGLLRPHDDAIEGQRLHLDYDEPPSVVKGIQPKLETEFDIKRAKRVIQHLSLNKDGELIYFNKWKVLAGDDPVTADYGLKNCAIANCTY